MSKLSPGLHQISVNGVQLACTVVGTGPLLFAPSSGWGVRTNYLENGVAKLLDRFTLVCIETRGSGRSSRPKDKTAMSTAVMADDIEHLRQHFGLQKIDLFGHSNAGAILISYAQRYPTNCRKLVLADSQLIGFAAQEETGRILGEWADDPRYRDAIPHLQGPFPFSSDKEFTEKLFRFFPLYFHDPQKNMPNMIETMAGQPVTAWAAEHQWAADASPKADQVPGLERIQAETLILEGRYDFITPMPVAERIQAGIKGSKLVMFENSGHMVWIEEPERFTDVVTSFLQAP